MKTTEEMIAVMQAYADGEKIEYCNVHGVWRGDAHPPWNWAFIDYRIAVTKDSIDWSHVSDVFNWMVREESGKAFFCHREPFLRKSPYSGETHWSGGVRRSDHLSSYKRGTCDWKDSLVERPHV